MRIAPLAVGLATLAISGAASAEQFVLVDADYEHKGDGTMPSHAYHAPTGTQPKNWQTPINYAEGTAYYRLEVFEKASDENLHMGICFVGGSYCCFGYEEFTKPGVYEWSFAIPMMWQYDTMDWSKNMTDVPLIMRDRNAVKVDPTEAYYGKPSTALYFPMKSHLTVTIVSKGGTYVKPVADAGVDAAADTSATDSAVAEDTLAPDDAAIDTGSAEIDAGGEDSSSPAADASTVEGSSCAMGRGSPSWMVLALSGLVLTRARRRDPRRSGARADRATDSA
ncbi:MAG: hypothetical protein ACXVEF_13300 [Polyangiales bacterium]